MKYFYLIVFLLITNLAFSQALKKIALSKVDSANIIENDTLYQSFLKKNDKKEASRHLDNNAVIYWKHNYYDKAVEYYLKSLELNRQLGNANGVAGINSNLALIYADMGEYEKSYEYFEKTLAVRKANNESVGIISALINESVVLNKLKKYDLSVKKLEEALSIAQQMNDEKQMRSIYGMLSETYQLAGNAQKALYYYGYYKTFNDYVTHKTIAEKDQQLQQQVLKQQVLKLENDKKQLLLEKQKWLITQQKEQIGNITKEQKQLMDSLSKQEMAMRIIQQKNKIQKLENEKLQKEKELQRKIIYIGVIALFIILLVLIWLFIIYRQKNRLNKILVQKNALISQQKEEILTQNDILKEVNKELNNKNEQITASINYAKTIQNAVLSASAKLETLFSDSFLLYKPKDIVAGDFYYFKEINKQKILVVGDCTGHGVPGAFLTILGINILNTALFVKKIYKPAEILIELDNQFKLMLNQKQSKVNDGMDVSICLIDDKNSKIEFSAARNPLILITKDKVEKIKGSRNSIGFSFIDEIITKKFETKIINVTEKTWIYMLSDGIIDQINGNRQRFFTKRLINILQENFELNGEEQYKKIEKIFTEWKGNEPQTDDVILLGIEIGNKQ